MRGRNIPPFYFLNSHSICQLHSMIYYLLFHWVYHVLKDRSPNTLSHPHALSCLANPLKDDSKILLSQWLLGHMVYHKTCRFLGICSLLYFSHMANPLAEVILYRVHSR